MLTPWVAGLFPVPHSPRSPECSSHSWRAVARAPFIEPVHDSDAEEIDHHHVYFSPPWSIPSPHTGKETTEKVNNFPQASQWANNVRDGIWAHACLIPKCVLWICSNTLSVARRSGFGTFLNSSFLSCSPYNSFYNSLYVLFLFLLFLSLHILPSLKKILFFWPMNIGWPFQTTQIPFALTNLSWLSCVELGESFSVLTQYLCCSTAEM